MFGRSDMIRSNFYSCIITALKLFTEVTFPRNLWKILELGIVICIILLLSVIAMYQMSTTTNYINCNNKLNILHIIEKFMKSQFPSLRINNDI